MSIFFVAKYYAMEWNFAKSMRKLSNLSPFNNPSHDVFFSVDRFFKRRRPINIRGAVTGNLRLRLGFV